MESDADFELMTSTYSDSRLYINFFQPVLKLAFKSRVDGKFIKTYDQISNPYQRIMNRKVNWENNKVKLKNHKGILESNNQFTFNYFIDNNIFCALLH